jgi:putative SOS response-associated peptidase YedK
MCGRFTLTIETFSALAALLGVVVDPRLQARYRPRWNVAPTQSSPMLIAEPGGARAFVEARWGISWPSRGEARESSTAPQILARAETITAPGKLRSLAHRRCIVPADGFFEWAGPKGDRRPFWFHAKGGGLLLFAGIHHRAPDGDGFAIVTTVANDVVAKVHDRMPAVLSPKQAALWLDGDDVVVAAKQLRPAPRELLVARAVSKRVSNVANDDPACLEPLVEGEHAGDEARDAEATRGKTKAKAGKKQLKLF